MNTNATHPLTQLLTAEANLVASIDAAADRLDALGTTVVDAALARFQAAALAATDRLARAGRAVNLMAGEVVADLAALTAEINTALAPIGEEMPALPTYEQILAEGDAWREEMAAQDLAAITGIVSGETIDLAAELPTIGNCPPAQQAQEGTLTAALAPESSPPAGTPAKANSEELTPEALARIDEKVGIVKDYLTERNARTKIRKQTKRTAAHTSNGTH